MTLPVMRKFKIGGWYETRTGRIQHYEKMLMATSPVDAALVIIDIFKGLGYTFHVETTQEVE